MDWPEFIYLLIFVFAFPGCELTYLQSNVGFLSQVYSASFTAGSMKGRERGKMVGYY